MAQDPIGRTPFAELDQLSADMHALLIGALDGMAAHPEIQRVRRVARDALRPAPGHRLLDAGCGLGEVARGLAADVASPNGNGAAGEVVALDLSAVTVAAAAGRHDGSAVRYVVGDLTALDFPDATFDGVRSERVLQHLVEPDAAIAELIRVTRPGGRVCLIDTDWQSVAADGLPVALVEAITAKAFSQLVMHHHSMGRTLRRRLVAAGLTDVVAAPVTCYFPDPVSASAVLPMLNPHVPAEAGVIPDELRAAWFAEVAAAGARGDFLAVLTIWVACGARPR